MRNRTASLFNGKTPKFILIEDKHEWNEKSDDKESSIFFLATL
jgi:hypothetical protein